MLETHSVCTCEFLSQLKSFVIITGPGDVILSNYLSYSKETSFYILGRFFIPFIKKKIQINFNNNRQILMI